MANNMILEKLQGVKTRFEEVEKLISDPEVIADMDRFVRLNKEYKDLQPIINSFDNYKNILSNIQSAKDILANEKDDELKEMAKVELDELSEKIEPLEEKIKLLLIPGDPERDIMEKRKVEGIPLMDSVIEDLREIGKKLEIKFPSL